MYSSAQVQIFNTHFVTWDKTYPSLYSKNVHSLLKDISEIELWYFLNLNTFELNGYKPLTQLYL